MTRLQRVFGDEVTQTLNQGLSLDEVIKRQAQGAQPPIRPPGGSPPPGNTLPSTQGFGDARVFGPLDRGYEGRQVFGVPQRGVGEVPLEPGRAVLPGQAPVPPYPSGARPPRLSPFANDLNIQNFRLQTEGKPEWVAPDWIGAIPRDPILKAPEVPLMPEPPPHIFVDHPAVRQTEFEREYGKQLMRISTGEATPPTGPRYPNMFDGLPPDIEKQVAQWPEATKEKMIRWAKYSGLTVQDAGNVLRANMASIDLSYLRQEAMLILPYPKQFAQSFPDALRAAWSHDYAVRLNNSILSDPYMRYYDELGLDFLRPLDAKGLADYQKAGEFIIRGGDRPLQRLVEYMPWVTKSGDAYISGMNSMNWRIFKRHMQMLERVRDDMFRTGSKEFFDINDSARRFGHFLEDTSGRGRLPEGLQKYTGAVNSLAFSARLQVGRFKFFKHLVSPDKYVRRAAWRSLLTSVGGGFGLVALGDQMGWWRTSYDPRSSDFMNIIVGNTRLDIFGGYKQYLVLYARLLMSASSLWGEGNNLTNTQGESSYVDPLTVGSRFARTKAHPFINNVLTGLTGRDFRGAKIDRTDPWFWAKQNGFLAVVDIYEALESEGLTGLPFGIAGVFGGNVQTHDPKKSDPGSIPRHRLPRAPLPGRK